MNHASLILLSALCVQSYAQAAGCADVQRVGYHILPPYCQAKCEGGDGAAWDRKLGNGTWVHVHHYCFGLAFEAELRYKDAIQQFDYVIDKWPNQSLLMPVALFKKGRLLDRLGMVKDANYLYQRVLKLNPSYIQAYAALSENALKQGDIKTARAFIDQGMKRRPDSKLLRERLRAIQEAQ